MRAYERLLKYVSIYTTSDPDSATVPSSMRQYDLARILVDELNALGLENVHVDENGIVYGWLSATPGCEAGPALGFIAHMDTAPDCSGENVKPQIIERYDGGDVVLPGSGETMINAALVAMEFNGLLPASDIPRLTEGYEGFFHLCDMKGDVENAELHYIVRDHDRATFEARKKMMEHAAKVINEKYGRKVVTLTLKDSYYNMREKIEPHMHLLQHGRKAGRPHGAGRKRKARLRTGGHEAVYRSGSRRNGRLPPFLHGSAHAEPLHRRLRFPRPV